jgi:prolyl oligopeptidase
MRLIYVPRAGRAILRAGLFPIVCAAILCAAAKADSFPAPPVAPINPVVDTYAGHSVTDSYQWMEKLSDPAVVSWLKGQSDYTNAVLATIPHHDELLARIKSLDGSATTYSEVNRVGDRIFYEKMRPIDQTPKLYVRDGLHGQERLLMDAGQRSAAGVHYAMDYYAPSLDGKYVAVGISPGGSEDDTIYTVDVDTGKVLPDQIDRARFGSPAWLPDGKSFFYNRLPKLAPGAPPELGEEKSLVHIHVLGRDPDSDPAVFGFGLSPLTNASIEPGAISFLEVSPVSPYVVGLVAHGVQNELTIFAAPLSAVDGASTPWRKLVDVDDDVTGFDVKGSTIYLLTHKDASRFKVVSMSMTNPDFATAKLLVPPSQMVIRDIAVAKDALYTTSLDGGISRLRKVGLGGGPVQDVRMPYDGSIAESSTDPRIAGDWFLLTGWTHSALWYSYNPATGSVADTGLKKKSTVDFSAIKAVEVKARAADGTMIPLSIIYPKDFKLDGSHPTILEGYGSYGIVLSPGFDPLLLALFEHGGIYAVAHVRGGGEYGEDWHNAGKKATKPNTWNDLIACSEYLIAKGYTSSAHLAIEGGSAGGITVGRAMTERPDLFGAVLDDVGASDTLRAQFSPNGPPNIPEFGDVTTPEGFKDLYEMDAYQHVKDGVKYPAVLLTTGINDPRVSPWEPAKMAARLQAATASGKPVLLRVDYDAGHGFGSSRAQSERLMADEWTFALWQLGSPDFQPPVPIVFATAPTTPSSAAP